ncbi:hypothetical protein [Celeribacter marinus]|uniref:Uncharacterized protein n=1 Tax=Celeribacter marinus TaxID=1397108 RepID=A0A0P0AA02_9RHOB|nr:hypothetical protein [Celeribacter marinus]ALI54930.1 hypothetical protein IMCC12053_982 [Celeribacter marinus]SFK02179.1 hypothetical protein SAMN05444421_101141 [Celeribacter marinus]
MIGRASFLLVSFVALTACDQPAVPDSGAGVGFGSYNAYQAQREQELISGGQGASVTSSLDAQAVSVQTPSAGTSTDQLIADAEAAIAPSVENSVGISSENDFDAVSDERSIEQDAARVAANRSQYQVVEPTAVPARPSGATTTLVAFALSSQNNVGQAIYKRLIPGAVTRQARNCAKYPSPDLAQEAFLAAGGPERNGKGLDADGDGFACRWDPAPFRLAATARNN